MPRLPLLLTFFKLEASFGDSCRFVSRPAAVIRTHVLLLG